MEMQRLELKQIIYISSFFILFMFLINPSIVFSQDRIDFEAVHGLIDIRSSFSDGYHSIEDLTQMAHERGFKVLFINDHDSIAISYGLFPFKNLLRFKKVYPSILTHGPEKYLDEIKRISGKYPDMIIIPGCETSAYYYWTGSFLDNDLTIHEYDRRMLILDFNLPEKYTSIPNIKGKLTLRYTPRLFSGIIIFLVPLLIGFFLLRWKGVSRFSGLFIITFSILAIIDYNPFRNYLFGPYDGDQGIAPYQELIDYINEKGGLSFWNYPEQNSGIRKIEFSLPNSFSWILNSIGQKGETITIYAKTPPYPQVLLESKDYTGFSAIYGDNITITDPGNKWDRLLNEYCLGIHEKPPFAISTADFHKEGALNLRLGDFQTTFLVREFTKKAVIESIKKGRMYASRNDGQTWPVLESFYLEDDVSGKAFMGDTLVTRDHPLITVKVSCNNDESKDITLLLIRGGMLVKEFKGKTPFEIEYQDNDIPPGRKTYYRLMDHRKHLTSNPIFVSFNPSGEHPEIQN